LKEPAPNYPVAQFQFVCCTASFSNSFLLNRSALPFNLGSSEHSIFSTESPKVSFKQCIQTTVTLICLMSVGLTATCNCLHCNSSKLHLTFSTFPLHFPSSTALFTLILFIIYPLPKSPPAALKLYSITFLYYYGLYRLYFFTHNAYINFVPSLLGAAN